MNIVFFIFVCLLFISASIGFIFIQIKAHPYWRLVSILFVIIASCWIGSLHTHFQLADSYGEYIRGSHDFVWGLDQLTMQGRTNKVHQLCGDFVNCLWLPDRTTNFDKLVEHTLELANEKPATALESTVTGPVYSTNK